MPAIKKQVIDEPIWIKSKIRESVWKRFAVYADYIGSSQDYCIEAALEYVMDRDKEFAEYEAKKADEKKRNKPAEISKAS